MRKRLTGSALLLATGTLLGQMIIGTPSDLIEEITQAKNSRSGTYQFRTDNGATLTAQITDLIQHEEYVSLNGIIQDNEQSLCLLKGDSEEMYGWIVDQVQQKAYEYTTNSDGDVVVSEVPVEKIIPICTISPTETVDYPEQKCGTNCSPRHSHDSRAERAPALPHDHLTAFPEGTDVRKLQSLPGAEKVMYLDIRSLMNGSEPLRYGKEGMYRMWQDAAASLSMYDVNVTTDHDVYTAAVNQNVRNTGIAKFYNQEGRSFAPLNSFGSTTSSTLYAERTAYGLGRTVAHEVGHQLGLLHDGTTSGVEYFNGLSSFKWTPIMGNYWPGDSWGKEALYQWSIGEYSGANRKEDDLALIARYLPFREDDQTTAMPLVIEGTEVLPSANMGQITFGDDGDEFTFQLGSDGGKVILDIDRIESIGGAMLDVEAELFDASGTSVAFSNASAARYAAINEQLPAGSYTLKISGGSEGTPQNGFSSYSSFGYYVISGTITGSTGTEPIITVTSPLKDARYEQGTSCDITWNDNIDDDVKITLLRYSESVETLVESTPSTGEFLWEIPAETEPCSSYSVVVASVADPSLADTSDLFGVTAEYIISEFPYTENFDMLDSGSTILPQGWMQDSKDAIDWLIHKGPTPSKVGISPDMTGPSGDYPSGTGNYLYVEASSENSPGKDANITTPKFTITDDLVLRFYCHMFSDSAMMGELALMANVDGVWSDTVVSFNSDSGDVWFPVEIPLAEFTGDRVQFQFAATTGSGWCSDIAIDMMEIVPDATPVLQQSFQNKAPVSMIVRNNEISYAIPAGKAGETFEVSLFNLRGQLLHRHEQKLLNDGANAVSLSLKSLSKGIYVSKMKTGAKTLTRTFVIQ